MGPETETVQVNFGRAVPVFPLAQVVLLPHAVTRLFVFEPRYRQMVEDVLDGAGLIAMASFEDSGLAEGSDRPALRSAVCVGKIADHRKNPDGTYHVALAGVCRAEIVREDDEEDGRLYRQAMLRPLNGADGPTEDELGGVRRMLERMVDSERFPELSAIREQVDELSDFPTIPLLDIASVAVSSAVADPEFAYRLLAEASVFERAAMLDREVQIIERVHRSARKQFDGRAPRGITWN